VRVVARPAAGRQFFEIVNIASVEDDVAGFERGNQVVHYLRDVFPTFLFSRVI
jgi:hypothetical protein